MTAARSLRSRYASIAVAILASTWTPQVARSQAWPDLPDLVVTWVDATKLETDCQTGSVSGQVRARVENLGLEATEASFHVAFFEDRDLDGKLDSGADPVLANVEVTDALEPGGMTMVVATVSATLEFARRPIHAFADSQGELDELNEDDNTRHSGANSVVMPKAAVTPVTSKYVALTGKNIEGSLQVVNLTDDDGDGAITEWDVPDIVASFKHLVGSGDVGGRITAIDGATGSTVLFTTPATPLSVVTASKTEIAVGDIDGDDIPDIVACDFSGDHVLAFDNTGQVKWVSSFINLPGPDTTSSGLVIADLDGVGTAEVIAGNLVFDGATGLLVGNGTSMGTTGSNAASAQSVVADIDLDGTLELVAGPTAYSYAGGILSVKWQAAGLADGYVAVANLDEDPEAEIVLNSGTFLRVLDHEGIAEAWWSPATGGVVNVTGSNGGVPTIDDLDGVAPPEILISTTNRLAAYRADGDLCWQRTINDGTSGACGVTTFDLDGDNYPEVIHRDEVHLRIVDGRTGDLIGSEIVVHSFTMNESPIVADVDNDGHAEVLVNGDGPSAAHGVYVFEGPGEGWVAARRICNQNSYHFANVRENGSIPRYERPHWLEPGKGRNSFRRQLGPDGLESVAPDLTVSLVARDTTGCPDDVILSARVGNAGSGMAPITSVAIFSGDPATGMLLTTVQTSESLQPGEYVVVELQVDGPFPRGEICFAADDDGVGAGSVTEIDEENNACCSSFEDPCAPAVDGATATLTYTGATGADHSDPAELAAVLVDAGTMEPIPQAVVTFTLDGLTCRAITDAGGTATCWTTAAWSASAASVTVASEAAPGHAAASVNPVSFAVTPEDTDVFNATLTVRPWNGGALDVSAVLKQDGAAPMALEDISFSAGGGPTVSGTETTSTGLSTATVTGLPTGLVTVTASFAATNTHAASQGSAGVYLLPPQVRLTPDSRLVEAGEDAVVTAQVLDDGGTLAGRPVRFCVLWGSPSHGLLDTCSVSADPTDGTGSVEWDYTTAVASGVDLVRAHVDEDEDGVIDMGEATATIELYLDLVAATRLQVTGDLTGDTMDEARIAATLFDDSVNPPEPIPNTAIELSLGAVDCLAVTDSSGEAECWITPGAPAGTDQPIRASFPGGPGLAPSDAGDDFEVTWEETLLLMGSLSNYYNGTVLLAARLWEDGGLPLAGKTVTFHPDPPTVFPNQTAITDSAGIATVSLNVTGTFSVHATFDRDDVHESAETDPMTISVSASAGAPARHLWTSVASGNLPGAPVMDAPVREGDGAIRVTWTQPSQGASAINGYVISAGSNILVAAPATTLTRVVTGLPNGTATTFTVRATNRYGSGPAPTTQSGTPLRVADPPTDVAVAVMSATEVECTWDAPAGTIDGYEVQPRPVGAVETAASSPHEVDDLEPGQPVVAWVRALVDDAGPGLWSEASDLVVTGGPPSEPLDVVASESDGQVTAYWRQPAELGGHDVAWYDVTVLEDGTPAATQPDLIPGSRVHHEIATPTPGVDYQFVVVSQSVLGPDGPESDMSTSVQVTVPPDEPELVAANRANGAVELEWEPPASNGGDGPRGYLAAESGGPAAGTALGADDTRWIAGLTNGTTRSFKVRAVNGVGASAESGALSAKPARGADAPAWADAPVHGDASATLNWTAPTDSGGEPITQYVITSVPPVTPAIPAVLASAGPPYVEEVTGLENGVEYRFMVHAVNAAAAGALSLYSEPVTPRRPPDPAENVTAVADGDVQIAVKWSRPEFNGGAAITGYRVVAVRMPAGTPVGEEETNAFTRHATFEAPDLEPCVFYRFDVYAQNSEGESATPGSSSQVRAATTPTAPTSLVAVRGDASGSLTWSPPTPVPNGLGDGCSLITGYVARCVPGDAPPVFRPVAGPLSASFTGLANGREYTFNVLAVNAIGDGDEAESAVVVPCSAPYPPLALTAEVSGDLEVSAAWIPPAWDGGCPLTDYEIRSTPTSNVAPTGPTAAWASGLTAGDEYVFEVRAENEIGWGAWSVPASVVAATVPDAPTDVDVRPGDTILRACWLPPSPPPDAIGWSDLLGYEVTVAAVSPPPPTPPPMLLSVDVPNTCVVIPDLANDQEYSVEVRAINAAGTGAPGAFAGNGNQATPRDLVVAALEIVPDPSASGVVGGYDTAVGKIRLNVIAGAGGTEVVVTGPPGAPAWGPSLVTVPEGLEHATFVIETDVVTPSETVEITASANGTYALDQLLVLPVPSGAPPLARIVGPEDGADVWDYETFVYIQVASPGLTEWIVDTRLATSDSDSWIEIGTGTTEMAGTEETVRFDPTLRLNGLHEIRLRAWDGTQFAEDRIHVLVRGNQKIGHFTISLIDLTIPVAGIPIQLVRTYDSRDKRPGDFGHGWRLSVSDVRIERNIPIGQGWEHVNHSGPSWLDWPQFCVEEREQHVVTVTFPTGKVYRFRPIFQVLPGNGPPCQIAAIESGWVRFVPVGFPKGKLRAVDADEPEPQSLVAVSSSANELYEFGGTELFDPDSYELTVEDGTTYRLDRVPHVDGNVVRGHVDWIEDRNGNRITIEAGGVRSSQGDVFAEIVRRTDGRVEEIVDAREKSMTYVYDDDDTDDSDPDRTSTLGDLVEYYDRVQVAKVSPAVPEPVRYHYDLEHPHHLARVFDQEGHRPVRNLYDADGRLTHVCDGYGASLAEPDEAGHCVELEHDLGDAGDRTERITDRRNNQTVIVYDEHGNVMSRLEPDDDEPWLYEYWPELDAVKKETDPLGHETHYTYDPNANMASIENAEDEVTEFTWGDHQELLTFRLNGGADFTWTYVYDTKGNLLTETDPLGKVTAYTPGTHGNVDAVADPLGHVTSYDWSGGFLESETDATGVTTEYHPDENGNATWVRTLDDAGAPLDGSGTLHEFDELDRAVKSYLPHEDPDDLDASPDWTDNPFTAVVYDDAGWKTEEHDPHVPAWVTIYEYDALGQLEKVTSPDGTYVEYQHDDNGNQIHERDAAGRITQHDHDGHDRLWHTWWGPADFDEDEAHVAFAYDDGGRLTSRTDELGNVTDYVHDDADRRIKVIEPDLFDGTPRAETETHYDDNGWVEWIEDPLDHRTTFEYDDAGRRVLEIHPDRTELPGPEQRSYEYDAVGRLAAEVDENGHRTTYGHDAMGRLTRITDALENSTYYEYDGRGNMTAQVDAMGRRTTYEHDVRGRRTGRILPLGQPLGETFHETWHYTVSGFIDRHVHLDGVTETSYTSEEKTDRIHSIDRASEPSDEDLLFDYTDDGQEEIVNDQRGTTTKEYDDIRGWLKRVTSPDGMFVDYICDDAGTVTERRTGRDNTIEHVSSYSYDGRGRLETVNDLSAGLVTYAYDLAGRIETVAYANGVIADHDYDASNALSRLTWRHGSSGPVIQTYDYAPVGSPRDAVGHIMAVEERGEASNRDLAYSYDETDRLTAELIVTMDELLNVMEERLITYTYDDVGNRLTRSVIVDDTLVDNVTYEHDANDRVLMATGTTYGWDDNGRLIEAVASGEPPTVYAWNDDDSLMHAALPNGDVIEFEYDSEGIRCGRSLNAQRRTFVADASFDYAQVLEERDDEGTVVTRYCHGHHVLAETTLGGTSHYVYDHLGSVRALMVGSSITNSLDYEAFGVTLGPADSYMPEYGFAGEQRDGAFDLTYLRARWMWPGLGSFGSIDPFDGLVAAPRTRHAYLYALNDPVRISDPDGRFGGLAELGVANVIRAQVIGAQVGGGAGLLLAHSGARQLLLGNVPTVGQKSREDEFSDQDVVRVFNEIRNEQVFSLQQNGTYVSVFVPRSIQPVLTGGEILKCKAFQLVGNKLRLVTKSDILSLGLNLVRETAAGETEGLTARLRAAHYGIHPGHLMPRTTFKKRLKQLSELARE